MCVPDCKTQKALPKKPGVLNWNLDLLCCHFHCDCCWWLLSFVFVMRLLR